MKTNTNELYRTILCGFPDVLDVKQVSEILNVSTKTVYRHINDGLIPSIKVGRTYRIPKLHLLKYMKVFDFPSSEYAR